MTVKRPKMVSGMFFLTGTFINDFDMFPTHKWNIIGSLPGKIKSVNWLRTDIPVAHMLKKQSQNSSCIAVGFFDLKTKM